MQIEIKLYDTEPCPCCKGGTKEPDVTATVFVSKAPPIHGDHTEQVCARCYGRGVISIGDDIEKNRRKIKDAMRTLRLSMLDLAAAWHVSVKDVSDVVNGRAYVVEEPITAVGDLRTLLGEEINRQRERDGELRGRGRC